MLRPLTARDPEPRIKSDLRVSGTIRRPVFRRHRQRQEEQWKGELLVLSPFFSTRRSAVDAQENRNQEQAPPAEGTDPGPREPCRRGSIVVVLDDFTVMRSRQDADIRNIWLRRMRRRDARVLKRDQMRQKRPNMIRPAQNGEVASMNR